VDIAKQTYGCGKDSGSLKRVNIGEFTLGGLYLISDYRLRVS